MKYEVVYNDNDGYGWTSDLVTENWQEALSAWSDNFCSYDSKAFNKIRVRTPENIAFDLTTSEQMEVHSSYIKYQEEVNNRIEQRIAKDEYMTNFDVVKPQDSDVGMNADQTPQPHYDEVYLKDPLQELAKLDIAYQGPREAPLYPEKDDWDIEDMFKEDFDEELKLNYGHSKPEATTNFHGDFDKMTEAQQDAIINPKHYKMLSAETMRAHPDGMEYIDLMAYLLEGHTSVQAHLLGQIYKYSMRLGKKDNKLQDAKKIEWYANRLAKEIEKEF